MILLRVKMAASTSKTQNVCNQYKPEVGRMSYTLVCEIASKSNNLRYSYDPYQRCTGQKLCKHLSHIINHHHYTAPDYYWYNRQYSRYH